MEAALRAALARRTGQCARVSGPALGVEAGSEPVARAALGHSL